METFFAGRYDVAVIGAGHAGIEAASAAARMGMKTVCFTINADAVGNMPCNPAIGGTGKGQLVREIDALGGVMAKAADKACIQYRMLNSAKGPAVHSLRAQADRRRYQEVMKELLESTPGLDLMQAEIVSVGLEGGRVASVTTALGAVYACRACVVCTGTYLGGRIIIGPVSYPGGPDGMFPSTGLFGSLSGMGLSLRRFKTGTPPRVNGLSIDFSVMEPQRADPDCAPFSFETERAPDTGALCWLTYTNEKTHEIIRENLHRAPLFSGDIKGVGPRYCPSIEDNVVRFPHKTRHQLFIEPCGLHTHEMYVQGFSSSMPQDVQLRMLHTVAGLENARVIRPAYAIEYDCVDPLELMPSLETKKIPGLFGAGQFNGSSGYEEAAAQGLMAGINAVLSVRGEPPFVLSRSEAYIGALIDDLVTKGTEEPYRMMTSRTEYRLILRQDNADLRLTKYGCRLGLVSPQRLRAVEEKYAAVERETNRLRHTGVPASPELERLLAERGGTPVTNSASLAELLRRPELDYACLAPFDKDRPALGKDVAEQVETEIKYEGYIKRQLRQVEQMKRLEDKALPGDIDYFSVPGLRTEARQKLDRIRPADLGRASRISGVSPADCAALMVWLSSGGGAR